MKKFQQITQGETEDGTPFSLLAIEGAANDVACYITFGEEDDATVILATGHKVTEKAARAEGASWPARLTYRR